MVKVVTVEELLGVKPIHQLVQAPTGVVVGVGFKLDQAIRPDLFSVYAFCLNQTHDFIGALTELNRHHLVKDGVCEVTFEAELDAAVLPQAKRIGVMMLVDNQFYEHVGFHLLEDVKVEIQVNRKQTYSSQVKTMPYLIEPAVLLCTYAAGSEGWEFSDAMLALDRGIRGYIEQLKPKPGKYSEWF